MSLLGRLFGSSTTNEQTYTCECGAPMENIVTVGDAEYRVETWNCTECLRGGQAYRFDDAQHHYGTGPLDGQVNP